MHSRGTSHDGAHGRVVEDTSGIPDLDGDRGTGGEVDVPGVGTGGGLGGERLEGGGRDLSAGDDYMAGGETGQSVTVGCK